VARGFAVSLELYSAVSPGAVASIYTGFALKQSPKRGSKSSKRNLNP
jgi:hypothetical protein